MHLHLHRSTLVIAGLSVLALAPAAPAASRDRDRDGLSDRWERRHDVRSAKADHDRDGLSNRVEFKTATNPRRKDSDGDGTLDTSEGAGRVVAVDGTTVTIALAVGGRHVTGRAEPGTTLCQPAWEWEGPVDTSTDAAEESALREAATFSALSLQAPAEGSVPNPNDGNPVISDDELERLEDAEYERMGHEDEPDWRETTDGCAPGELAPGAWVHEVAMSTSDEAGVEFEELLIVE